MTSSIVGQTGRFGRSASGMITPMDLPEILPIDVSIDLGRGDVDMTKHLLYRAEIGPPLEKVRREGVPQRVGRHVLGDCGAFDVAAKDLPGAHSREGPPARVEEEHSLSLSLLESRPELAQVDRHGADRGTADGNEPLLAALAEHANETFLEQEVANAERDPLRHPETGAIRELEERPVAEDHVVVERRRGEETLHLVDGEHVGQLAPSLRRLEPVARVAHDDAVAGEEAKVGADGRDVSANAGRREAEILEVVDVFAQRARGDVHWRGEALPHRVLGEPIEVAAVRLLSAERESLLERDVVGEALEQEPARACVGVAHQAIRRRRIHQASAPAATIAAAAMAANRP